MPKLPTDRNIMLWPLMNLIDRVRTHNSPKHRKNQQEIVDHNSFNQISHPSKPDRANSLEFGGNRNQE
jgi:hypothetical protein